MQGQHDEDILRNRPLHELLNEDDDVEKPYVGPQTSFGDNGNGPGGSPPQVKRRLLKLCAIAIAVVLVIGGALTMIMLAPAKRYGTADPQVIIGETHDSTTIKRDATADNLGQGAVSTDHAICSSLGNHILNYKGGNVVDAAVAAAVCLAVVNPCSSGLGGGMFMMIHIDPNSKDHSRNKKPVPPVIDSRDPRFDELVNGKILTVIDAREVAPEGASKEMYKGLPPTSSTVGGLAVAVPGEIRGLEYAHAKYGRLSWREVLDPSVRLAREGLPISKFLAEAIENHLEDKWNFLPLRSLLSKEGLGLEPLQERDIMRNPALGAVLESIADDGADALYDGDLTQSFLDDIRNNGGILTENDLRRYKPTLRSPLVAKNVAGYTLVGPPPPSSGGATLMGAARYLAGFHANGHIPPSHHRMAEALKHAFAIRMSLSDPDYNSGVVADAVMDLVSSGYIDELRRNSSDDSVLPLDYYGGAKWSQLQDRKPPRGTTVADFGEGDRRRLMAERQQDERSLRRFGYLEDKGTSHLSVMDIHGNAVSLTSSLNTYFGSGVLSPSTGILLNNQMDDFATPGRPNYYGLHPSEANFIAPGKKPLSSMAPTMVFRRHPFIVPSVTSNHNPDFGELLMTLGASGGPKIVSSVLQVFWNYAIMDQSLFDAVHAPRIHDQLLYHDAVATLYEDAEIYGFPLRASDAVKEELEERGHNLVPIGLAGSVQVVAREKHGKLGKPLLMAVSDARKGGKPAGL